MTSKSLRSAIRRSIAAYGWDIRRATPVSDMYDCLIYYAAKAKAATLLDVGANTGQFAQWMFDAGWKGRIVSFEPQSAAHALLSANAAGNNLWEVAPRVALGAEIGSAVINIAGNSESSSLLPMTEAVRESGENLGYVGTETVEVIKLADWIAGRDKNERYLLKLDVQGFEGDVIQGAREALERCPIIHTEMSLQEHYVGELMFHELSGLIIGNGYRCVGIRSGYYNSDNREVIQADGTFLR